MWVIRISFRRKFLAIAILMTPLTSVVHAQSINRAKAEIEIGAPVQVSKTAAAEAHYEQLTEADPERVGRLISCAAVFPKDIAKRMVQYCYVSFDQGKSWESTLKVSEGDINADPAVVYGRGGEAFVVSGVKPDVREARILYGQVSSKLVVYKSLDGGRTWREASRFPFIDRPYLAVDRTKGKYAGRLYIMGHQLVRTSSGLGPLSLQLMRSVDGGNSFIGPTIVEAPRGMSLEMVFPGALLSDGTLVIVFSAGRTEARSENEPLELHAISTSDGGETFGVSHKISNWSIDEEQFGQLTVDPGSIAFKDRLYFVYSALVSGRRQIQLSYSSDRGKTWSAPVIINDDLSEGARGEGADHSLPAVAVNKDGIVLVTWYDRRQAIGKYSWRLRTAVSLDGGETFSASVPVANSDYNPAAGWDSYAFLNQASNTLNVLIDVFNRRLVGGNDTRGLTVDGAGTFYPTWIDNHLGIAQLWCAPIKVEGKVVKHGAFDLASLQDISESVNLKLWRPVFDEATGRLSLRVQLQNLSDKTIDGMVKIRVLGLESSLGIPEITNADNGVNGTGAVWDFSSQMPNGHLPPMGLSLQKVLTFKLSKIRLLEDARNADLINIKAIVLGTLNEKIQ